MFNAVDNLMKRLVGHEENRHSSSTINELFDLHNQVFPENKETGRTCGSCRARVYSRLKMWWESQGGKI